MGDVGVTRRSAGLRAGHAVTPARGFRRSPGRTWTPADRVTLTRLVLIGGVTALVADRLGERAPAVMIVIASVALVLDSVDGFHPLGRRGQPSDVTDAIAFLAGDGARWITGTTLPVDGGVLAGRSPALQAEAAVA